VNSVLLALGAITLWSTNAVVAKYALGELGVEQVQLLQFAGASMVFLLARIVSGNTGGAQIATGAVLGVVGITGTMMFQYLAFAQGPIAEVNIVAYAWPLIAALLFIAIGKVDRPVRFSALTALGFFGATMVIARDGHGLHLTHLGAGHTWAIASALCMASYSVAIGRVNCDQNTAHLAGSMVGLTIAGLWCVIAGHPMPDPASVRFWLALYLGAGPIGIGYLLWARAMRNDATGRIASLGYLTPVGSTTLLMLSGTLMGPLAVIGSIIVIICCAATGIEAQRHVRA
jgi:drug/metabolite transporter (DMT)-like permease